MKSRVNTNTITSSPISFPYFVMIIETPANPSCTKMMSKDMSSLSQLLFPIHYEIKIDNFLNLIIFKLSTYIYLIYICIETNINYIYTLDKFIFGSPEADLEVCKTIKKQLVVFGGEHYQ